MISLARIVFLIFGRVGIFLDSSFFEVSSEADCLHSPICGTYGSFFLTDPSLGYLFVILEDFSPTGALGFASAGVLD